jgi:hypothetical protein
MYTPPQIEQGDTIKYVEVKAHNYTIKDSSEILNTTFDINGTQQVFLTYNSPVNTTPTFNVTGGTYTLDNSYANGAILSITATGTVTVIVTGTSLEIAEITYLLDDTSIDKGKKISINNPLVNTETEASTLANSLLSLYKKILNYILDWRQDMSYTIGDTIAIEDEFGENQTGIITKQEINYDGTLSGKTEAKG